MLIYPQLLPSIFSLLLFLPIATSYQHNESYHPKDHCFIKFGLSKFDQSLEWRSDEDFLVDPPSAVAANTSATAVGVKSPYDKARMFRATVTYSIPVNSSGPKLVRLYLYPPTSTIYNPVIDTSTSSLNLIINGFQVLRNFSAYLVASNANANPNTTAQVSNGLVREIYVTVAEERDHSKKSINLTFSPSSPNGFGFINSVEIISVPQWLYINRSSDNPQQVLYLEGGPPGYVLDPYDFPNSLAMENVIRLNVGGYTVDPSQDTGIDRTWYNDVNFVRSFDGTPSYTAIHNSSTHIPYTVLAPNLVYSTMRMMGPYIKRLKKNMTWEFEVDNGFNYLVRLHFCELDPTFFNNINRRLFSIYINNQMAWQNMDVLRVAGGLYIPIHTDFVILVNETSSRSRVLLSVTLIPDFDTHYADALLNGLEIFKLSSTSGSLAAPNPAPSKSMIQAPISTQTPAKSKHLPLIIGSILGATLVSLLIFVCLIIIYRRNKKQQKYVSTTTTEKSSKLKWILPLYDSASSTVTTASVASKLPSDLCRYFTLAQIKAATRDFDKDLIIGTGGFGKVYKGTFDDGNTTVAIKRLNSTSKQGAHEFQTEIEMLSRLRHVHLVSLIGYCEDFGEMILVYEYMPNGTLRDHLLYKHNPQISHTSLSWKQRLMICLGSARGLHYLHAGAKHLIIHRDVKSTNILLDEKWTAKVSDFGLSKVGPDHTEAGATYVSTAVKGSAGYLDPEYYRCHQLTEKSDVYSFGVVLFEVLCARAAVNPNLPKQQANLAIWARSHYKKGTLHTIVDPNLTGQIAPESLRKFGEIANMCVRDRGIERPSMGDVVWGLEFALQLQETAEDNNIANGTPDESFDLSISYLSAIDVGFTDNDISTNSGDNFSQSSVVEGTSKKFMDSNSKSTTSSSSDYLAHSKPGSVFSEITHPTAR
ncbi:receptor-like protein kinase FERONIA [Chenopodium quinoa]|uniref:Protein kinase domain-containing protein n=1 Tax=Chenopodium quinoa TaxID=63459 RepID=A0A803LCB0_CHEQI|nr:receptor-like protein kinase FERONIA [Chenopodium quinoa]XP_021739424.1 receptor-like protein kinase FERONIA [Chenopodium quinoa]